ncbi:MAG: sodium:solute symporter family protein [Eubacteriales bacterium]|nr:sodium:solute symporter family protein [Eubacteriales bacterium]
MVPVLAALSPLQIKVLLIVIVYLLAMLAIGFWSSKKIESNEDFMLAGRKLGPLLLAGTLAATEIGGGSSLGVVEKAYGQWGLGASWYVITMGIAFVILAFIAPKLRSAEVKTVPEYFRRRYGRSSGIITAIIMLLPLIGLTASQFIASATILSALLGINLKVAITVVAIVVTVYSIMGGLWAVAMTDFVQVFLIVLGMGLAVPYALNLAGGWGQVVQNVPAETLSMFQGISVSTIISLIIMYTASFMVGQEAVSRFYAARSPKVALKGSVISAIVNFVYAFIPTVLGIITLALVNMGKMDSDAILADGAKMALPHVAMAAMPVLIVGLLFSGIICATMSSADSDLLGAGSIFANDLYKQYIRKEASANEVMNVTRVTMLIVGIFAWLIAISNSQNLINILMFSFTLRAAGSFFPYIFGLYWKKSSIFGTIASLVGGSAIVIWLEHSGTHPFGQVEPIIPGLVVSFILFIGFSLLAPSKRGDCELAPEE